MKTLLSKLSIFFVATLCFSISFALSSTLVPNDSLFEQAGDFVTKPGRFKEYIVLKLDGSDDASRIERKSSFRSEVVFLDRSKWRVIRQTPFQRITGEFANSPRGVLVLNSQNHGVLSPEPVPESTWLEVTLGPVRLGEALGLFDKGLSLVKLVSRLKDGPIQNDAGNKIELETKPDGALLIKTTGVYTHDKKTKVGIEATWEYLSSGKVSENDLVNSLTRSL